MLDGVPLRGHGAVARDYSEVKNETLGNISHLPDLIRRSLKREPFINPSERFRCVRILPHGHVADVLGTLKRIGPERLIDRKSSRMRDLTVAMIAARVIDARSKLGTARALNPPSAITTLGDELGLGEVDQHELYAAMDWIGGRQRGVDDRSAHSRHPSRESPGPLRPCARGAGRQATGGC